MQEARKRGTGYEWTDDQIEFLKKYYGKKSIGEVSAYLGKSKPAIRSYAHKNKISSHRYMSRREIEIIKKNIRRMTYEDIDRKLKRPLGATRRYCYHNGMQKCELTDCMKLAEVARLVGRHRSTISKTWVSHGLVIKKAGQTSFINVEHLLEFMQANPERWDATKCERWYFQQYDWFEEKRKEDFDRMIKKRWGEDAS